MVDLTLLKELLPLLKSSGVSSFKMGTLELLFKSGEGTDALHALPALSEHAEHQLPADLRTDGATGYDNLLFHSASPSNYEVPLPGLGEAEL